MATDIQAVLFDFGGVFTDSPFHAVHAFGEELGLGPAEVTEIVFGSYEQDGDHPWHRLERGEITLESARESVLALGEARNLTVDIYELFGRMAGNNAGADQRQPLVDCVRRLKEQGYRRGIVTNNVKVFGEGWRRLSPVGEVCDFVVGSRHGGVRKPDPAIFEIALSRLPDLKPEQVVFLDDYSANVSAASAMGMHTITVGTDLAAVIAELDALLEGR